MAALLDKYLNDTLKNNPLVYYRMREGSGATMTDSSPNANNGAYTSMGWINPVTNSVGLTASSGRDYPLFNSGVAINSFVNGVFTQTKPFSTLLDGAASRATATLSSPAINTGAASSVTVEGWVRWDGVLSGSNGTFEALFNFNGASGLLLGFLKNGAADYRFGLSVRNTGDLWGLSNAETLASLTRDTYHHIVFVIVNNNVQTSKLYIDGVLKTMTQQIGTSTTTDSVTSAFAIGYDGTASFFGGSIGDVAVYNGEPYVAAGVRNRFHQGAYGAEYGDIATVPGIETQVEFPGLSVFSDTFIINDKNQPGPGNRTRTLDQLYLTDIGGLDDSDIRFSEESNFYRDGMNPLVSRVGGKTITLEGYIEASNFQSMRQIQNRFKTALGTANSPALGLTENPVYFRNVWNNGFDFLLNVRKSQPLQMKDAQDSMYPRRRFLATLRSSFPFFESVGARTEVLIMGATTQIPNKGNQIALPLITFWGPFTDARLVLNNTIILQGSVLASTAITVDCKNRTCSDWSKFSTSGDFPYILSNILADSFVNTASFSSVATGTAGVTRVEITWRHTTL